MVVAQVTQKGLEVRRTRVRPAQQQAPAVAHIERPEQRTLGVVTTDGHVGLLTAQGPGRPQGRSAVWTFPTRPNLPNKPVFCVKSLRFAPCGRSRPARCARPV